MHSISKSDVQRFVVSLMLLIPAALLIGTGLLHSLFEISSPMNNLFDFYNENAAFGWMANPLMIMGGVFVAFMLSARQLITLSASRDEMQQRGRFTLTQGSLLSWLVIGTCLLMALVIFLYLLAENFGIFR